jgi:hypothetical protein
MKQVTFSGAPTQALGAALYRHAMNIKQEVDSTADEFTRHDNGPKDLCDTVGTIVLEDRKGLSGSLIGKNLESSQHTSKPTVDEFGFNTTYESTVKLSRREEADGTTYGKAISVAYKEFEGTTVFMNANGSMTVTIPGDITTREADWAGVKSEKVTNFGPNGPADASSVKAWTQAQHIRTEIDEQMSQLKAWDGTGQDLNPTPGIAVFAESDRRQVTEKAIHFDPASGSVHSFAHHTSDGEYNSRTWTYRQENGDQIYSRTAYLGLDEVRVAADRSVTFTQFAGKVERSELPAYLAQEAADAEKAEKLKADIAAYDALPWYKQLFTHNPKPVPHYSGGFGAG